MIKFRQREFSEYDAMRSLYVEIMKLTHNDRNQYPTIDSSGLVPVLRGNNIVVEKFVISTTFFGKDRFRMYLRIGARAKMPDQVRLTGRVYDKRLGNVSLGINNSIQQPRNIGDSRWNYEDIELEAWDRDNRTQDYKNHNPRPKIVTPAPRRARTTTHSEDGRLSIFEQREFGKGNNNGGGQSSYISSGIKLNDVSISYEIQYLLGDAIKYDKQSRLLVLEFASIQDAIRALNILPFGLGYKIYFLDV